MRRTHRAVARGGMRRWRRLVAGARCFVRVACMKIVCAHSAQITSTNRNVSRPALRCLLRRNRRQNIGVHTCETTDARPCSLVAAEAALDASRQRRVAVFRERCLPNDNRDREYCSPHDNRDREHARTSDASRCRLEVPLSPRESFERRRRRCRRGTMKVRAPSAQALAPPFASHVAAAVEGSRTASKAADKAEERAPG